MIVCILGRQPRLGAAELEALYGAERVRLIAENSVAIVDVDTITHELGGTIKVARQLDTLPVTKFDAITSQLTHRLPRYLRDLPPEGKVKFGLSVYGLQTNVAQLTRNGLFLKKAIKKAGRSVRVVPNTALALSSAQVIHNQMTSDLGFELVLIRDGDTTIVARTTHEQDIEAYTLRDRGRPKRDAFVGMLPPKLAQIMLHLGTSPASAVFSEDSASAAERGKTIRPLAPSASEQNTDEASGRKIVLDPFCGTGVVLQEAALEGYGVYGTDLSEKMVDYTTENLKWLERTHRTPVTAKVEAGDATTFQWQQPIHAVVCEAYLGQPMSQEPKPEKLADVMFECNSILKNFLKNIHPQLQPGTPLCVAAPAWFVGGTTKHLPALDDLENLGYNRIDFVHADKNDLIYHREDQIVGRELLVLIRR